MWVCATSVIQVRTEEVCRELCQRLQRKSGKETPTAESPVWCKDLSTKPVDLEFVWQTKLYMRLHITLCWEAVVGSWSRKKKKKRVKCKDPPVYKLILSSGIEMLWRDWTHVGVSSKTFWRQWSIQQVNRFPRFCSNCNHVSEHFQWCPNTRTWWKPWEARQVLTFWSSCDANISSLNEKNRNQSRSPDITLTHTGRKCRSTNECDEVHHLIHKKEKSTQ